MVVLHGTSLDGMPRAVSNFVRGSFGPAPPLLPAVLSPPHPSVPSSLSRSVGLRMEGAATAPELLPDLARRCCFGFVCSGAVSRASDAVAGRLLVRATPRLTSRFATRWRVDVAVPVEAAAEASKTPGCTARAMLSDDCFASGTAPAAIPPSITTPQFDAVEVPAGDTKRAWWSELPTATARSKL